MKKNLQRFHARNKTYLRTERTKTNFISKKENPYETSANFKAKLRCGAVNAKRHMSQRNVKAKTPLRLRMNVDRNCGEKF